MSTHDKSAHKNSPIAIVGMGCIFPKAQGNKDYWRLLFRGTDCIEEIPKTHWSPNDYFDKDPKAPDMTYCRRGGFLSTVAFDPTEFGIPPMALEATDTSQLLSLVVAKMAMQDAGYGEGGKAYDKEKVSVILGATGTQELVINLGARLGHPIWRKALLDSGLSPEETEEIVAKISDGYVPWQENSFPGLLGNVISGRIASRLDFGGTNCAIDAACASSLSAMHLGLLELQSGEAEMVLTGGSDALNDIFMYMCFSKTPALSPTGDLRPFSSNADGTTLGEGIGIVALKRLEDAERDQDDIYAVIQAMGSSSDGRSQSIYAPRAAGQQKAIRRAYQKAGVTPEQISLIEAHGTGTKVGDAVEFDSLKDVFGETEKEGRWCAIGSVKSQIGHTKSAAGAASVIKAALALYHKVLPPTLKVEQPNPKLDIENTPFYLNTEARPWFHQEDAPRRAGVSSFGFGGSNFHVLLEEYQSQKPKAAWNGGVEIVPFSADSREALRKDLSLWAQTYKERKPSVKLAHLAHQARLAFDGNQ
ncbi:MAG TPA: hypothetical protein DCE42_20065, partial [Myxococcales bacterium]|nr:hypothetical protein [Myxococcales bacterium]